MKHLIEFSLYGSLATGGLNLLNQYFDPNKRQIDFDEVINESKIGLKAGAVFGGLIDLIDTIEPKKKLPRRAQMVWNKGEKVFGFDSNVWRKSKHGHLMKRSEYGNRSSEYGWEVEHGKPVAKGGTNHPNNLSAENWRENLRKGKKYPYRRA